MTWIMHEYMNMWKVNCLKCNDIMKYLGQNLWSNTCAQAQLPWKCRYAFLLHLKAKNQFHLEARAPVNALNPELMDTWLEHQMNRTARLEQWNSGMEVCKGVRSAWWSDGTLHSPTDQEWWEFSATATLKTVRHTNVKIRCRKDLVGCLQSLQLTCGCY